jgi:hypothetical protein
MHNLQGKHYPQELSDHTGFATIIVLSRCGFVYRFRQGLAGKALNNHSDFSSR